MFFHIFNSSTLHFIKLVDDDRNGFDIKLLKRIQKEANFKKGTFPEQIKLMLEHEIQLAFNAFKEDMELFVLCRSYFSFISHIKSLLRHFR